MGSKKEGGALNQSKSLLICFIPFHLGEREAVSHLGYGFVGWLILEITS